MRAPALLAALRALGALVELRGGRIRVSAPSGVLTSELRELVRAEKPALVEILMVETETPTPLRPYIAGSGCCEGGPIILKCKLCRQSSTYWRNNPDATTAPANRRIDALQERCTGCSQLFVDVTGRGCCLACAMPANKVVA